MSFTFNASLPRSVAGPSLPCSSTSALASSMGRIMWRFAGHHGSVPRLGPPHPADRLPLMLDLPSTRLTPDEREPLAAERISVVCVFGRDVPVREQAGEHVAAAGAAA